jgi:GR25 family glycosyltransferase involved in LPS biosynthesis
MSKAREINIFFIHAQWLKDRERVISEFQKLITKYNFKDIKKTKIRVITDCDPSDVNPELISKTVNYDQIKDEEIPEGEPVPDKKLSFYNGLMRNLHVFQLSNSLKHYKALEEISKNSGDNDINIVLEDDILYEDKVCMLLERLISDLQSDYGLIFLGLPSNLDVNKRQGVKYQNTSEVFRVLPYCDSYIISTAAAKILYNNYLPIKFVNNVQLSYVLEKVKFQGRLALPNIFMDGSKYGLFLSVLSPNNILLFNNEYMKVKMLLDKPINELSNNDNKEMEKIFKESVISSNPDLMHLHALYKIKNNAFKEAEDIFENGLKIYQAYNCILNHESQFLRDYIKNYKNLQVI